jgi:uncharacterized protein with LGFP repeats
VAFSLSRRGILRSVAWGGLGTFVGRRTDVGRPADVSADAAAAPAVPAQPSPIHAFYLSHGGAAGVLGVPSGEEEAADAGGLRRHFRATLYGASYVLSMSIPQDRAGATCGRPDETGTEVESTVTWSAYTGAHAVHAGIRERWLSLGGERGVLGYPIGDEEPTSDGLGRLSRFQHGEILWYPGTGAVVHHADPDV